MFEIFGGLKCVDRLHAEHVQRDLSCECLFNPLLKPLCVISAKLTFPYLGFAQKKACIRCFLVPLCLRPLLLCPDKNLLFKSFFVRLSACV